MSLERRNLQNLIHRFEISGKWPMDQYSKTLAQEIIDAGYRRSDVDNLTFKLFVAMGFNQETGEGMIEAIRGILIEELT